MFPPFKSGLAGFMICFALSNLFGQVSAPIYLQATKDAMVISNQATTNFATSENLSGTAVVFGSLRIIARSYVQFDLAGAITANQIPANAVITNASLTFGISSETGVTNSTLMVQKITSSWTETGVTYNATPSVSTLNPVTTSVPTGFGGWNWRSFNVTQHVSDYLKGVESFEGWCLSVINESTAVGIAANYYSKEYSHPSGGDILDPQLSITYYVPYAITSAVINHCTPTEPNIGSITPVIAKGSSGPSGTNIYRWYKNGGTTVISNATALTGQGAGWYGLEVEGALGDKFYMAFVIGTKCRSTPISFRPGPKYLDDIQYAFPSILNVTQNPSALTTTASYSNPTGGAFTASRALGVIKFKLWVPSDMDVTQANFSLYGSAHSGTSNATTLSRNTGPSLFTYMFPPEITATGALTIPHRTGATDALNLDVKHFWNEWKTNNTLNYGMTLTSATMSGNVAQSQVYHSAEATALKTPLIDFVFDLPYSGTPCMCNPAYAKLEKNLKGVNYQVCIDKLQFYYEEEYSASTALKYTIKNSGNVIVMSNTTNPLAKNYGDNRYELPVTSLGTGTYLLEVVNEKNEKFYLRFSK